MPEIILNGRSVGPEHPPLVIVEVGINHEGSVEKARQLIDAAVAAGAEIVKFQCHITDKEMVPTDMKPGEISDERLWDIIARCELTEEEERGLQAYCTERGALYLSTPFSREAADRLDAMGVPAFKIGSGECNNLPLLDHIAAKGKPIILSTGMNDTASVRRSVEVIRRHGVSLALMQCTSLYPTPYEQVRLGALRELADAFPDLPVGLSDHSLNIWTCLGAVALGASILEKHFTLSRQWPGPDTGISIEPVELQGLIEGSRAIWQARGGSKQVLADEQPVMDFAFASVVTIAPVPAGAPFTRDNVWVKRPGTGAFPATRLETVLTGRATRDLPAGIALALADVALPA
ncbi:N-acetylneuraminate synthase family protein [Niveispirillum fermenti]|uniref:N-acetylneuraminate synthase family protein n=1 Tax=Niveispirillum fermenti TaxID=1233113 RepID=UPI003A8C5E8F